MSISCKKTVINFIIKIVNMPHRIENYYMTELDVGNILLGYKCMLMGTANIIDKIHITAL